ncbi:MAG: hypothetical protein IT424_07780 [Pirellulales bacterium]|nr:hypothetical protein [Pirellulales bacterium]
MTVAERKRAEAVSYAGDLMASLPLLEDLVSRDQLPYLARLNEWAELVVELADCLDAELPGFAGMLPRID